MSPLLSVKNVSKTAMVESQVLTILNEISFSVNEGTSTALIGRSGSGKTTLLGLLAGLDSPSNGEIYLMDQPLHQLDEEARAAIRALYVGFIFQNFQLLPNLTVLDNVLFPLEILDIADAGEKALHALAQVGLSHRLKHYPALLSGGEQQRVAIARAVANHPKIIFADEPTGNLDTETGARIESLLFELVDKIHSTLILVTHNQSLAQRCTQIINLENGAGGHEA